MRLTFGLVFGRRRSTAQPPDVFTINSKANLWAAVTARTRLISKLLERGRGKYEVTQTAQGLNTYLVLRLESCMDPRQET